MTAKVSAETKHAIYLATKGGKTVYEAAAIAGVFPSTIYRALERNALKQKEKKKLDSNNA